MFGFLPVYGMPYTSSLIPAILTTWVMSKVEHFLDKVLPELIKGVFLPLLVLLIMITTFAVLAHAMGPINLYWLVIIMDL